MGDPIMEALEFCKRLGYIPPVDCPMCNDPFTFWFGWILLLMFIGVAISFGYTWGQVDERRKQRAEKKAADEKMEITK
jgi:hypothetical protein